MKKNAVLIAGIMFVAGCAHQGGYASRDSGSAQMDESHRSGASMNATGENRGSAMSDQRLSAQVEADPTISLAHDPAYIEGDDVGVSASAEVDTGSGASGMATERHRKIQADSSIRGGSDRARGHGLSRNQQEPPVERLDARIKADSSIRGGSNEARGQGWRYHDPNQSEPSREGRERGEIKADSSIRGGSDRARGWDVRRGQTHMDMESSGSSAEFETRTDSDHIRGLGQEENLELSQNWMDENSDLQASGSIGTVESGVQGNLEVGSNDLSNRGSGVAEDEQMEDIGTDVDTELNLFGDESLRGEYQASGTPGAHQSGTSSSGADLRDSISADFDAQGLSSLDTEDRSSGISAQIEDPYHPSDTRIETEAQGGFGGVEAGASSSSEGEEQDSELQTQIDNQEEVSGNVDDESQVSVFGGPSNDLFRSNPAHGIGAPARTETDSESFHAGKIGHGENDLASKVQAQLTKHTGGIHGATLDEVRNIEVTSDGAGTVTLKGSVSSKRHKEILEIRAREVEGVKKVNNQITINSQAAPENRDADVGRSTSGGLRQ